MPVAHSRAMHAHHRTIAFVSEFSPTGSRVTALPDPSAQLEHDTSVPQSPSFIQVRPHAYSRAEKDAPLGYGKPKFGPKFHCSVSTRFVQDVSHYLAVVRADPNVPVRKPRC